MKILNRYLYHIQNSVFQGALTPKQFNQLKEELYSVLGKEDSIYLFYTYNDKDLKVEQLGKKSQNKRIIID